VFAFDEIESLGANAGCSPEMFATFGSLGALDRYFLIQNDDAHQTYPGATGWNTYSRGTNNTAFFINRLVDGVSTFITVAKHDTIIYSPDIRYAIDDVVAAYPDPFCLPPPGSCFVVGTSYDRSADNPLIYPPGTIKTRHGRMGIDIGSPTVTYYATMPGLYESGHSVSARAPAELLADVMDWYARSQP
jgi:hypothetical protein